MFFELISEAMVSLQTPNSPDGRKTILELDNYSKKRKWDESQTEGFLDKRPKSTETTKPIFEIELQLDSPLPLEWQRCLDIQSGQIYFYNTRTQKRTSRDPREPPSPAGHMSLDLELNLTCDSQRKNSGMMKHNFGGSIQGLGHLIKDSNKKDNQNSQGIIKRCPSWLAFEGEDHEEEMVATVCTRCHLLVMLCKSSPSCPNCKFMHPSNHSTSPKLLNQFLSLLC